MNLNIQINSFIFSFFYGIFFEILLNINYKIIYSSNMFIKIIGTLLFVITNTLIYFIILLKINNGVLHIYFFLSITLGYTLMCKVRKKVINKKI